MNLEAAHKPPRKRWLWVVGALAALLLLLLWLIVQRPSAQVQVSADAPAQVPVALTVTVARPHSVLLPIRLQANGNISAWQEASVGAEVGGLQLTAVKANVGDVVQKGQVLATLASETLRAEVLQHRARLLQAQAQYENAQADAARARSIQDSGALSDSQEAQFFLQEKLAHAQRELAQAALSTAELRLTQTQVRAPDGGVIAARSASVGAVVGSGQELFRLLRQSRMEWRAELTAAEMARIRLGQQVLLTLPTGLEISGSVRAIAPAADPQTRNILVFVDLPRHAQLKAGTFARGWFEIGQSQALTVPSEAVVLRDGHSHVFVLDAQNQVSQRKVQTGRRVGEQIELLAGLQPDETVAVRGAGFLNPSDRVRVVAQ
ncbi:efflux RND transporter periplasmic adaptor subunit [Hydrogenophaga sp.]|uniref:efflux RND transporter periplasmic adaptor subunit n=1 Tax=Hydrogenophaga sp. TaxID=1904254 RepID=UPI0019B90860|nr:efflux RND transporter periplasmic adaptor subunit [Hydrogenophaga sp.]MBD3892494.1 efflux RND transporter periplasmic adaptor subunit [Hydrogenophaga sp.]